MRYEALGEEWELAFPFKVQRELEERYNKGFYGIARVVAPNISGDIDLDKDPVKLLDAIGDVRVGVLVDMLAAGTEGMTQEQAEEAYEEMSLVGAFTLIFRAINPEVEDDAANPPRVKPKKKTPTKKRAG